VNQPTCLNTYAIDFVAQHKLADTLFAIVAGAFSESGASLTESTLDTYFSALGERDRFIHDWDRFFDAWDVLLCPACGCTATAHESPAPMMNGKALSAEDASGPFLPLANGPISGCPVIVMPLGRDKRGMPFGLQLIGRRWDDERLLVIAAQIAKLTDGYQAPPQM
jgi:amidase